MRETQSMAFFNPPGIDQLYSGDTMISPSALRMASAQATISAGKPVAFWRTLHAASFPKAPAPARYVRGRRCRSPCATSRRSRAHRVAGWPRFTPRRTPFQLFGATRAMKAANAVSCCLSNPRVASSLSSPVFSSNLDPQLPMKISGLLSVNASRNIIDLRRSY